MSKTGYLIASLLLMNIFPLSGQADLIFHPIAEGFSDPVVIVNAGDQSERLFIGEQRGVVKIIDDIGTGNILNEPFLDIQSQVKFGGERGFLGMTFHPEFPDSPYFYVQYTYDPGAGNDRNRLSRFELSANMNMANPNSEMIVLEVEQPRDNHNGGDIKFGPTGYLYIALGDGGGQFDPDSLAQNPSSFLGKILRIDIDQDDFPADTSRNYAIPPDNPFISDPDFLPEIWALGLRNPWRFSFDPIYNDMYIADVGQNAREEVNFQPANSTGGENYGWNCKEGTNNPGFGPCLPGTLTDPLYEYDHNQGCSITGGFVYRGSIFPNMQGFYLCIDYCTGNLWMMDTTANQVFEFDLSLAGNISTFGLSESLELYAANIRSGNDKIYRVFDRNRCPDTIDVPVISDTLYLAESGIMSNGNLTAPASVVFSAGDSVQFSSPFQVDHSAQMSVWAESCTEYILKRKY